LRIGEKEGKQLRLGQARALFILRGTALVGTHSHVFDFVVRVGVVPLSLSFKGKMRRVKRLAGMLVT